MLKDSNITQFEQVSIAKGKLIIYSSTLASDYHFFLCNIIGSLILKL